MDKTEQVARWFESHAMGSLAIRKEEDGDIDQVAIKVSEIEMKTWTAWTIILREKGCSCTGKA